MQVKYHSIVEKTKRMIIHKQTINYLNRELCKIMPVYLKDPHLISDYIRHNNYNKLKKKYSEIIGSYTPSNKEKSLSEKVWICWFQGEKNAPPLVRACINSIREALPQKDIIILDNSNIGDFIEFPAYIQKKKDAGIITLAQYSDLLRVALLCKYGGLWTDATVLCTAHDVPDYILKSPLFVYKELELDPKRFSPTISSSWLINSCADNDIIKLTKKLLWEYWKDYNTLKDYFIFHMFFAMSARKLSDQWENFHKLNHHNDCSGNPKSIYSYILNKYT